MIWKVRTTRALKKVTRIPATTGHSRYFAGTYSAAEAGIAGEACRRTGVVAGTDGPWRVSARLKILEYSCDQAGFVVFGASTTF